MELPEYYLTRTGLGKESNIIIAPYNDSAGVTRYFNLNLLERLNRELDANFNVSTFLHRSEFDKEIGEARSYLESSENQTVHISALELSLRFRKGEKIRTEISEKYCFAEIDALALASGFEVEQNYTDSQTWFTASLWKIRS